MFYDRFLYNGYFFVVLLYMNTETANDMRSVNIFIINRKMYEQYT